MDAHVSQFYEWLPWIGGYAEEVPEGKEARKAWLRDKRWSSVSPAAKPTLEKWYGTSKAAQVKYAESFEICEYGSRPSEEDIKRLFPMLGK